MADIHDAGKDAEVYGRIQAIAKPTFGLSRISWDQSPVDWNEGPKSGNDKVGPCWTQLLEQDEDIDTWTFNYRCRWTFTMPPDPAPPGTTTNWISYDDQDGNTQSFCPYQNFDNEINVGVGVYEDDGNYKIVGEPVDDKEAWFLDIGDERLGILSLPLNLNDMLTMSPYPSLSSEGTQSGTYTGQWDTTPYYIHYSYTIDVGSESTPMPASLCPAHSGCDEPPPTPHR